MGSWAWVRRCDGGDEGGSAVDGGAAKGATEVDATRAGGVGMATQTGAVRASTLWTWVQRRVVVPRPRVARAAEHSGKVEGKD